MKRKPMFDEHGLIGSSGLGAEYGADEQFFHIAGPFSATDKVFVEVRAQCGDGGTWARHWKRVPAEDADPAEVICCIAEGCSKPAVSLSHYWPYMIDGTLCAEHLAAEDAALDAGVANGRVWT